MGLTDLGQQPRELAYPQNFLSDPMPALGHCTVELSVSTMFTFLSQDNELRCLHLFYKWEDQHPHLWRVVWACASSPWLPVVWPGLVLTTQYLRQGGLCIMYYSCLSDLKTSQVLTFTVGLPPEFSRKLKSIDSKSAQFLWIIPCLLSLHNDKL